MDEKKQSFRYRLILLIAVAGAVCCMVSQGIHRVISAQMAALFMLFLLVVFLGILQWKSGRDRLKKQAEELKLYQLYIQPLEELVKEIRVRQHAFDNDMNAVLNMHFNVDTYEELVEKQTEYVKEASKNSMKQYIPLLRISDKILAGFLYSKILSAAEKTDTELYVGSYEIVSRASEHDLIEVVGIVTDNAYEACEKSEKKETVKMYLDSHQDKIQFCVKNPVSGLKMEDVSRFFELGYSTKDSGGKRGIGLFRAKRIIEKAGGEITASLDMEDGETCFSLQITI